MTERGSMAALALVTIDVEGTGPGEWTGRGTQVIWSEVDAATAVWLRGQLAALLGDPDREVLLDDAAVKALRHTGSPATAVVYDRDE